MQTLENRDGAGQASACTSALPHSMHMAYVWGEARPSVCLCVLGGGVLKYRATLAGSLLRGSQPTGGAELLLRHGQLYKEYVGRDRRLGCGQTTCVWLPSSWWG